MSERNTTTTPSTSRSIKALLISVLVLARIFSSEIAQAAGEEYRSVSVADAFLEMHTGPGRGYPIFHVVDRGDDIDIVMRRTDWFKIRAANGTEGWVDRAQMERTLQPEGTPIEFAEANQQDFTDSKWELGGMAGDFGGSNVISLYGAYSINPYVSIEVWGSQILGNFSNGWMGSVNLTHETWPDWRISPFFTLGTGVIHTEPKPTIVQGEDRTDQIAHAGAGFRVYATRRFILRAEFKSYVVFTSRDDNEEVEEWKVGFAFFF
ncbi:MAG: SH3 domain-containing protein [Gammaproteobacteria bacterium]|jgi:hypothetical protein|nr:SH3 domain-containing protein [Gammaproteobacteria bacterium]